MVALGASLVAQMVKNLPAMEETQVGSMIRNLPWRRNGCPFQFSFLENSIDRGAWQATAHRFTKSQT